MIMGGHLKNEKNYVIVHNVIMVWYYNVLLCTSKFCAVCYFTYSYSI